MTAEKTADANTYQDRELDEELAEVLIAISVITKRLAKKINENLKQTEVLSDEQSKRCSVTD